MVTAGFDELVLYIVARRVGHDRPREALFAELFHQGRGFPVEYSPVHYYHVRGEGLEMISRFPVVRGIHRCDGVASREGGSQHSVDCRIVLNYENAHHVQFCLFHFHICHSASEDVRALAAVGDRLDRSIIDGDDQLVAIRERQDELVLRPFLAVELGDVHRQHGAVFLRQYAARRKDLPAAILEEENADELAVLQRYEGVALRRRASEFNFAEVSYEREIRAAGFLSRIAVDLLPGDEVSRVVQFDETDRSAAIGRAVVCRFAPQTFGRSQDLGSALSFAMRRRDDRVDAVLILLCASDLEAGLADDHVSRHGNTRARGLVLEELFRQGGELGIGLCCRRG